jgi:hypothetical protein
MRSPAAIEGENNRIGEEDKERCAQGAEGGDVVEMADEEVDGVALLGRAEARHRVKPGALGPAVIDGDLEGELALDRDKSALR